MGGKYLLDTSVSVDFLRGVAAVRSRIGVAPGICISVTVLGELLFGVERSATPERGLRDLEQFLHDCPVLACDEQTARPYSRIKATLAAKGKPIPENDIWIAASAMQHGLTLATRDEHFNWIDGLDMEQW